MGELDKEALKLMIIEDSKLLRGMLVDVLSSVERVSIVAEAEDEEHGLQLAETLQPNVVIIDLELSGGSGLGVLAALRSDRDRYGNPRAVVFTNHSSGNLRRRCENLGVDGFFDKSYQLDDLIDYVQAERDTLAR